MKAKLDNSTLLTLTLSGWTQTQIAEEFGLTKSQVCRRVNDPDFQELLSEYRKRMLEMAMSNLTANTQRAINVLVALLDEKNPFARYSAASRILSLVQDMSVQEDLLKEIEELKKSQESTTGGGST